MRTLFIVNPRSGRARAALPRVQAFAVRSGAKVTLTERSRHASELAAQARDRGVDRIVAVGGDGTLNEVATQLVGTPALLGLIPCGSGNGLGRHLGIHGSIDRALDILRTGEPRRIDTGVADRHPFFTVAGLGFEAEVSASFNRLTERGFARYLTTSLRHWRTHAPEEVRIEYRTEGMTARLFTLAVANTDQYGNDAFIAPGARVDDGLLDLTVVPPVSPWRGLPFLTRLFRGSLGRAKGVIRRREVRFVVHRPAPGLIHTDGETHRAGARVEFTIRPLSLSVIAPPAAAPTPTSAGR